MFTAKHIAILENQKNQMNRKRETFIINNDNDYVNQAYISLSTSVVYPIGGCKGSQT